MINTPFGVVNSAHENGWDVILLGGNNAPPSLKLGDFCRRVYNCQTATGYIVKKHYYDVLIKNMRDGLQQLLKNPENKQEYALDMYWKQLQRKDNWFMIIPPTVIQYANYSNIEKKNVDYKHLMMDLDKEWLFGKSMQPQVQPSQPQFHNMTYFYGK